MAVFLVALDIISSDGAETPQVWGLASGAKGAFGHGVRVLSALFLFGVLFGVFLGVFWVFGGVFGVLLGLFWYCFATV